MSYVQASQQPLPIRLLIGTSCPITVEGFRSCLASIQDIILDDLATTGEEVYRSTLSSSPDIVLIDDSIEGLSAITVAQQLYEKSTTARILLFVNQIGSFQMQPFMYPAIRGYVFKGEPIDHIIEAVRSVAKGVGWISSALMARRVEKADIPFGEQLSTKELEVVRLIAQGWTNEAIALQFQKSKRTVGFHLTSIYNKLNVKGRGELISWAVRMGCVVSTQEDKGDGTDKHAHIVGE